MINFNKKQLLFILLLLCGSGVYCFALPVGDSGKQYRDSIYRRVMEEGVLTLSCHFSYIQNSSDINPALDGNRRELDRLNSFICATLADTALYVKRVGLSGFCSIEGSYAVNERLARDRVQFFKAYLDERYQLSEAVPVDVSWVAEDWGSLYKYVLDSRFSGREEVLRLIEETDVFGGREAKLARVQGGRVYESLLRDYFPKLRWVEIRVEYDLRLMLQHTCQKEFSEEEFERALAQERARLREEVRNEVLESLPRIDTVYHTGRSDIEIQGYGELYSITHTEENPLHNLYYPKWGIKINLMHLAGFARGIDYSTLLPNLSIEHFFTRGFSVEAGMEYSNWSYNSGKEFQGLSGYRIEPRLWLRHAKSLCCAYMGVFGQMGDFNLRRLRLDAVKGVDMLTGNYYEGGLSAGCYLPLSRHWGVDMGVRGGYRQTKGQAYEKKENGNVHLYERTSRSLRLTSIVLSLCYRWGN
jgi:hypothetical protein